MAPPWLLALFLVRVASLAPPVPQSSSKGFDRGFDDTKETNPVIQWYPGHIAKAEKQLVDKLKVNDLTFFWQAAFRYSSINKNKI